MHNPKHPEKLRADEIRDGAWYRQPVLWLGAAIFVASLAGCVWMIVLGAIHADEALPTDGTTILKMPMARPSGQPDSQPTSTAPESATQSDSR